MFFKLTLYTQRYRMIAYAVLVAAVTVLSVLPVTFLWDWKTNHWYFVHATDPRAILLFWQQGTANVIGALTIVLAFCAGDFGVTAMGDDSQQRTLEWVATRPRTRQNLAWAAWAASLVNALVLVGVGFVSYVAVLLSSTREVNGHYAGIALMSLIAPAVAMLSLAYFLSVGTGSARNGYLLALFTLVFAAVLRYGYFTIVLKRYIPLWFFEMSNLYQPQMSMAVALWALALSLLLSVGGATVFARRNL